MTIAVATAPKDLAMGLAGSALTVIEWPIAQPPTASPHLPLFVVPPCHNEAKTAGRHHQSCNYPMKPKHSPLLEWA